MSALPSSPFQAVRDLAAQVRQRLTRVGYAHPDLAEEMLAGVAEVTALTVKVTELEQSAWRAGPVCLEVLHVSAPAPDRKRLAAGDRDDEEEEAAADGMECFQPIPAGPAAPPGTNKSGSVHPGLTKGAAVVFQKEESHASL